MRVPDILDLRFAFLSTVMAAGEEDDDEGEDEDDDPDDDDNGSSSSSDDKGTLSSSAKERIKAANDEAKKHRLRAKEYARKLREREKADEERAEKEKPELERLKNQVAQQEEVRRERDELKLRVLVLEKAIEYKVSGDVDFLEYKLRKQGLLKLDEEGDLPEEFEDAVKKLVKDMNADSAKDSESGDRSDEGEKPQPPKSPKLSGKKKGKEDELTGMSRRFPALTQRSPV